MQALNIAATGMLAQQTNVEVISNNISNMGTTGLKGIELNSKTCFTKTYDGLAATRQTREQLCLRVYN